MKTITVTIFLMISFVLLEIIFKMLNEANTVENIIGLFALVLLILVNYKAKLGLSIFNFFKNLKTKTK